MSEGLAKPDPTWLDDDGLRCWYHLAPTLKRNGHLVPLFETTINVLCSIYEDWFRSSQELLETGRWFRSPKGRLVLHPLVLVVNSDRKMLDKHLRDFGLEFSDLPEEAERLRKATFGIVD